MLAFVLKRLVKFRREHFVSQPMGDNDIAMTVFALGKRAIRTPDDDGMARFCESFAKLQQYIEGRTFSILPDCQDAHGLALSDTCSQDSLDLGLAKVFKMTEFIEVFFRSIESLVVAHSVTVTNPFGTIDIPTDDSITAAVSELPLGYRDVLLRLQFKLAVETAPSLFLAVYDSKDGFGGPGTALRLIIDMIESQLFNREAIASSLVFTALDSGGTLASALVDSIIGVIGPYPSNMAYGPILAHIFYLEAVQQRSDNLQTFLDHCHSDHGMAGHPVHRMGLLTILGTFLFSKKPAQLSVRADDLFCRSQIGNEVVSRVLTLDMLKRVVDAMFITDTFDYLLLLALSDAAEEIEKYGTALISAERLAKVKMAMISEEDENRVTLAEDYDILMSACDSALSRFASD